MSEELIGTGIRMSRKHMEQLDRIADAKRVSRNVVILWALDEYLARFFPPTSPSELTNDIRESRITATGK